MRRKADRYAKLTINPAWMKTLKTNERPTKDHNYTIICTHKRKPDILENEIKKHSPIPLIFELHPGQDWEPIAQNARSVDIDITITETKKKRERAACAARPPFAVPSDVVHVPHRCERHETFGCVGAEARHPREWKTRGLGAGPGRISFSPLYGTFGKHVTGSKEWTTQKKTKKKQCLSPRHGIAWHGMAWPHGFVLSGLVGLTPPRASAETNGNQRHFIFFFFFLRTSARVRLVTSEGSLSGFLLRNHHHHSHHHRYSCYHQDHSSWLIWSCYVTFWYSLPPFSFVFSWFWPSWPFMMYVCVPLFFFSFLFRIFFFSKFCSSLVFLFVHVVVCQINTMYINLLLSIS